MGEGKLMEDIMLFDKIQYDSKPIPNQPIEKVIIPRNTVFNLNFPIVEELPPENMEKIWKKLSERCFI